MKTLAILLMLAGCGSNADPPIDFPGDDAGGSDSGSGGSAYEPPEASVLLCCLHQGDYGAINVFRCSGGVVVCGGVGSACNDDGQLPGTVIPCDTDL
jgi:hypothetical protein